MSDRLRVLSFAHSAIDRDGGRLRYRALVGHPEVDLRLVVPDRWHQFGRALVADPPDGSGIDLRIEPIWLPKAGPMSWYLHFYPAMRRLVREFDPDVIHLWEEPWSIVALQASLCKGRAFLVLEVDQNILKRLPPPFELMRRFVLRRTAHILSRSPDATNVVRACGYDGAVSLIGYGVDEVRFQPMENREGRLPGAPLMLGYVGRIIAEKGLDDALLAMRQATHPVTLAIMGEGPHESHLRVRVQELGLADRVTIEGWGAAADVSRFMGRLDALVLLTRTTRTVREQFGRVIIEAQSCGIPVIGSSGGAIPSVVGDGGWIVPESDPAALARLLDRLAADDEERRTRSLAALANVRSRFTYAATAKTLVRAWTDSVSAVERMPTRSTAQVEHA